MRMLSICCLGSIVPQLSKCLKGPVKLIKRVKIAHSFLQSLSNQFHVIILSLPMLFFKWLSNKFSKTTSKIGEIGRFKRALLIESI